MGSPSLLFSPRNASSAPLVLPPVGPPPSTAARPHFRLRASSRGDGPSRPLRPDVVVTRERGKNANLINALARHNVHCLEFPLVKHIEGPDLNRLPSLLRESRFDWIVITSPEAASVFLDSWSTAGSPKVRIAVVGSGTAAVLNRVVASPKRSLDIAFSPSKATGRVLSSELPKCDEGDCSALYPASVKAGNEIEEGLTNRGFKVKRLNTYSTVPVDNVDQMIFKQAFSAPVLAVASPSALRAWINFIPKSEKWDNSVACIGETTAFTAKRLGLKKVYHPENPGFEGWVESILEALRAHDRLPDVFRSLYMCCFV